jgi:hypothetical protein
MDVSMGGLRTSIVRSNKEENFNLLFDKVNLIEFNEK